MVENAASEEKNLSQIGVITEVHGPVVVIACDTLPHLRQALSAHVDHETYLFEVHQHLDQQHVRAITLHRSAGLRRGMTVYDSGAPLHIPVSRKK
jgi:F-type H+-transporting ATPase subunit beta